MNRTTVRSTTTISKPVRFRRWNRTGFALFASLRCEVSIGSIAKSIIQRLDSKLYTTTDNEPPPHIHLNQTNQDTKDDHRQTTEIQQNNPSEEASALLPILDIPIIHNKCQSLFSNNRIKAIFIS